MVNDSLHNGSSVTHAMISTGLSPGAKLYKRHLAMGNSYGLKSAGSITDISESLRPGPVTLYGPCQVGAGL
jgi:hypothetical protein